MSERTAKVESIVRQTVALAVPEELDRSGAYISLTAVDVSPDLRHAIVWFDVLADDKTGVFDELTAARGSIQRRVAAAMTTKFVPRLEFRLDAGGEYADHISRVMKDI